MISEAAASVPFRASEPAGALAKLVARPNGGQAGPDLMENFYGHLAVSGDAFGADECIRFSFAASDEKLTEAMDRLKVSLAKLK